MRGFRDSITQSDLLLVNRRKKHEREIDRLSGVKGVVET